MDGNMSISKESKLDLEQMHDVVYQKAIYEASDVSAMPKLKGIAILLAPVFLKKVMVDNGKTNGYVYFFKRKTEKTKNWMIDYVGLQPENVSEFKTLGVETKKGLAVRNESEIDLTIEKTIEIFELKNRKRVVLTGNSWGGWGGLF